MTQPANVRLVVEDRLTAALATLKAEILGGADPAFDTLLELQQALGDDPDFAATVVNELAEKVDNTDPRLSDARTPTSHTHTKNEVGLGNVDNTSDANKPISTAVQTALDSKASAQSVAAKVTASGSTTTLWSGTQSQYNALSTATRNSVGFIAVITP